MTGRRLRVALVLLALAACSGGGDEVEPGSTVATSAPLATPAVPTEVTPGSPTVPAAPNVGTPSIRDEQVRIAVARMAEETGYPPESVRVVRVEDVVWPSRALGCPAWDDGEAAEAVLGYRIILAHEDVELHFHGADGQDPRRCDFLDF